MSVVRVFITVEKCLLFIRSELSRVTNIPTVILICWQDRNLRLYIDFCFTIYLLFYYLLYYFICFIIKFITIGQGCLTPSVLLNFTNDTNSNVQIDPDNYLTWKKSKLFSNVSFVRNERCVNKMICNFQYSVNWIVYKCSIAGLRSSCLIKWILQLYFILTLNFLINVN